MFSKCYGHRSKTMALWCLLLSICVWALFGMCVIFGAGRIPFFIAISMGGLCLAFPLVSFLSACALAGQSEAAERQEVIVDKDQKLLSVRLVPLRGTDGTRSGFRWTEESKLYTVTHIKSVQLTKRYIIVCGSADLEHLRKGTGYERRWNEQVDRVKIPRVCEREEELLQLLSDIITETC